MLMGAHIGLGMTDEEPVNWYRLLEMGSRLLLLLYGFGIVMFSLSLWFIGGKMIYSEWMPIYLLWIGLFVWVLWWYLWRTEGGMRFRVRVMNLRTGSAKTR
jgi:hypothetical protein